MQKQEIEILVHPDGSVEYTIQGVKGSACEGISALLEQLGQVTREERTGEYYEYGEDAHVSIRNY
jgi:hypothetical protein